MKRVKHTGQAKRSSTPHTTYSCHAGHTAQPCTLRSALSPAAQRQDRQNTRPSTPLQLPNSHGSAHHSMACQRAASRGPGRRIESTCQSWDERQGHIPLTSKQWRAAGCPAQLLVACQVASSASGRGAARGR